MIDTDLLSIVKIKKPEIDISEEVERTLAQIAGVKKEWVEVNSPSHIHPQSRAGGKIKTVKSVFVELSPLLKTEFSVREFVTAMKISNYVYSKSSWKSVPDKKLKRLLKLGIIERVGCVGEGKYRKLLIPDIEENKVSERSKNDRKTLANTIK